MASVRMNTCGVRAHWIQLNYIDLIKQHSQDRPVYFLFFVLNINAELLFFITKLVSQQKKAHGPRSIPEAKRHTKWRQ